MIRRRVVGTRRPLLDLLAALVLATVVLATVPAVAPAAGGHGRAAGWRHALRELAELDPPPTVVLALEQAADALDAQPGRRRDALAARLRARAEGFDGSGDRVVAFRDGVRTFVASDSVRGGARRRSATPGDVAALRHAVGGAERLAAVAVDDATRLSQAASSSDASASGPVPSEQVSAAADAVESLSAELGRRHRPTRSGTGVDLALASADRARAHLERADRALARAHGRTALWHLGLAWGHARLSLAALGLDPSDPAGDLDGDTVPDSLELTAGTDPTSADTDGDGLTDSFELARLGGVTDATVADTDGDGTGDADEDVDGDTLTNGAEQEAGTVPTEVDADRDDLDDAAELVAGTDPAKPDTDGDTLLDGAEVALGLDPTDPDTDGDGTRDDEEVATGSVAGPDGVVVTVTGTGDVRGEVTVETVDGGAPAPGQVGPTYRIEVPAAAADRLAQATIDLPLGPATEGSDPADRRIFTYDQAAERWVPVPGEQQVDAAAGRVRVTVDSFSRFAVFDIVGWRQTWSTLGPAPCTPGQALAVDVVLMIDASGSMADNDPQGLRLEAATSFVGALGEGDRAAVSSFDGVVTDRVGLTSDTAALEAAVRTIPDDGTNGTDITAAVRRSLAVLAGGDASRGRIAILLSDGEDTYGYDPAATEEAAASGVTFYTVGLGASVDVALLEGLARATGGAYHPVASADDLPEVFRSIGDCVEPGPQPEPPVDRCEGRTADADGDGLPDCVETAGFLVGWGARITTDPAEDDTDGDGLSDGQEAGEPSPYPDSGTGAPVHQASSDPTEDDTDGDGLTDGQEVDEGTDPLVADVDGDGLSDAEEVEYGTDPYTADSDGDGLGDGHEVDHVDDEGTHPLIVTEVVSKWTYAAQVTKGVLCGDATFWQCGGDEDSIARLTGTVVRGYIPFSDVTDLIANLVSAEFVSAGLSVAGLVPIVGDTGKALAKIVEFGSRHSRRVTDLVRWVARSDWMPQSLRRAALEGLQGAARAHLRGLGWTDDALDRLALGSDRADQLRQATEDALHRSGDVRAMRWYRNAGVAERQTVRALGGTPGRITARDPATGRAWRFHDGELPDGTRIEVKSGHRSRWNRDVDNCEQARKDREMVDAGQIPAVVWHFVPSHNRVPYGVGVADDLLTCMRQYRIPFVVHHPG